MNNFRFFSILALAVLCVGVNGCSGGAGSGFTPPPVTYYSVTLSSGTGTTGTLTTASVAAGSSDTVTGVGLLSGYQSLVISGCSGTLSGTTYTFTVNATCTVTISATPLPTYTVNLTLVGVTGTLSATSVPAGSTVSVTGVGATSGYRPPITATNCVLSGTICTSGGINGNTTITISATPIPVVNATLSSMVVPSAVFDSDFATASITIKVVATGSGFTFQAVPTQALSTGYSAIPLKDTGVTANGGEVYSVTITPGVSFPGLRYYGKSADFLGFIIFAEDGAGNTINNMGSYLEVGIISKSLQVNSTQVASGVFSTPNAVNIVQAYTNPLNIAGVTQGIYNVYPDVFDTIVVSNSRADSLLTPAHFSTITNSVLGIGNGGAGGDSVSSPSSSSDSFYGSGGQLKGITQESPVDVLQRAFLHELGHTFAFFLNNSSLDLTRGNGAHQLALCSNPVGWLGANQYMVQQPGGDFTIVEKSVGEYSDLELYLMGLEPASAVPNQYCVLKLVDPEQIGNTIPFSTTTSVAMTDIMGVYGTRSPSSTTSQKSFRVLFVWLSENQPTSAELALHDDIASFYASSAVGETNASVFPPLPYPFAAATKGNGTLTTAVPAHK